MIRMFERVGSDGAALSAGAEAVFYDHPNGLFNPDAYELLLDEGSCRYFRLLPPPLCNPPCGTSGMCNAKAECVPWPHRILAGPITVTGLVEPVTLTPDASAYYASQLLPSDIFGASSTIKVSAAGGEVPAFTTTLPGVDPVVTDISYPHTLEDGHDNLMSWTPQGDGATVEVAIQIGWPGGSISVVVASERWFSVVH
jgi:hypothetical protein